MKKFFMASLVPLCGAIAMGACSDDPTAEPPNETPEAGAPDATDATTAETGTEPEDALPKSGSCLSARYVTTSDGLKVWTGIFDTKLDAVCLPTKKYDDALRCAPLVFHSTTEVSYSDTGCTKPVVDEVKQSPGQCDVPRWVDVQVSPGAACEESRFALFKIATAKKDFAQVYTKAPDGKCNPSGGSGSYSELEAIPGTELVKLTEAIDPITGQIGAHVLAGDDGSRFAAGDLVDIARGNARCRIATTNENKPRCVPTGGPVPIGYSENGCTTEVAGYVPCTTTDEPNKKYVTRITAKDCTAITSVSELGAVRANKDIYTGEPVQCSGPYQNPTDVFDIGPEVSPALFPELTPAERGGTRIVAGAYRSADKIVQVDEGTYTDKQPGAGNGKCYFDLAADGKLRCIPSSGNVLYSDALCQTMAVAGYASDCAAPKTARLQSLTCPLTNKIYAVGAPIAATKGYFKTTNDCLEIDVKNLYTLGAEIPPETFAEGMYVPK